MLEVKRNSQVNSFAASHVPLMKDSDAAGVEILAMKNSPHSPPSTHVPMKKEFEINGVDLFANKSSSLSSPMNRTNEKEEAVCSPARSDIQKADDKMAGSPNSPEQNVKSVPIHCIIEHINAPPGRESVIDIDTYAILPGTTLFCEVIRSTLVKIGYPATETIGAKGAVQIRNWKPLSFDAITDNRAATVQEILGDLSSIATLRIKLASSFKELSMEQLKEKLFQFFIQNGDTILNQSGCPLDKHLVEQLAHDESVPPLCDEQLDAFNSWFTVQAQKQQQQQQNKATDSATYVVENNNVTSHHSDINTNSPDQALQLSPNLPTGANPHGDAFITIQPQPQQHQQQHGAAATALSRSVFASRTRLRTSFDQEHEIPRLQKWFELNQHPCREQMMMFVAELNALPSRHGRRALDLTNITYWFKNARAANRRALQAGREGVQTNIASFMDTSFNDASETDDPFDCDVIASHDSSLMMTNGSGNDVSDKIRGNGGCGIGIGSGIHPHAVPELPNRNAVYVVTPIHHSQAADDRDQIEVVNLQEDNNSRDDDVDGDDDDDAPKDLSLSLSHMSCSRQPIRGRSSSSIIEHTIDTPHNLSISSDKENHYRGAVSSGGEIRRDNINVDADDEQACDLSLPKKRRYSDDDDRRDDFRKETISPELPLRKTSRLFKSETDMIEEGYTSSTGGSLSPSPRSLNSSLSSASLAMSGVGTNLTSPSLNFSPFSAQHAMQMALLNMQFMHHPAAALYPPHRVLPPVSSAPPGSMSLPYPHNQTSPLPHLSSPLSISRNSSHDNGSTSPGRESIEDRKKRSRVFIDPLTEIPKLEKWFLEDTHPSSYMIEKYTDDLNMSAYRQRFPRLEPKNVQLWFKNHRAKVKRARLEQQALSQINNQVGGGGGGGTATAQKSLPSSPMMSPPCVTATTVAPL